MLKVDRLTREGVFTDVSFEVRAGEIVALAGLVGAGRTEVARAIFGIDRRRRRRRRGERPQAAPGLAERGDGRRHRRSCRRTGASRVSSCRSRSSATWRSPRSTACSASACIPRLRERRFASEWATRLQLRYGRLNDPASTLSGGNQQKIVLAKWLARKPKLLIVDEPTRGIDVGTKAEVHRLLSDLANEGVAILMISSELPEVLGMADRVIVLFEGRVAGEFGRAEADEVSIMRAAAGVGSEEAA